jgi:hypothetical protein
VYGANVQNAIKNRAAVPRQVDSTPAVKIEPAKKEPPPVAAVKKDQKRGDLAEAFAHAKPKKSPEKGTSGDTAAKKPPITAGATTSNKNGVGAKKGAANNIASMFAKQECCHNTRHHLSSVTPLANSISSVGKVNRQD